MNDTFLKACRGEKTDYVPVWLMRQAGRYLPDYKKLSDKHGFLALCRTPELAAEVTIQPVDTIGADAAIFFSDILTTVAPMGMDLHYENGKGPSFSNPVRNRADVERLVIPEPEEGLGFVYEAQKILVRELANKVPLIGFAGSPFTVASFMIEGVGTHSYVKTRGLAFREPAVFHRVLTDSVQALELVPVAAEIFRAA